MNLLNKLTIKNLKLNKHRTVVTIIGILLSVALITAVASMFFAARESLIRYEVSEKGNYHYAFKELTAEQAEEIQQNRKVEHIYLTSDLGYAELEGIQNEDKPYVHVKAMTANAMENLGLTLLEGRMPENENEILVSSHLKTNGRVTIEVGETVTLDVGTRQLVDGTVLNQSNPYFGDGEEEIVNAQTKEYEVVGIIERLASEIEGYSAPGYTFVTYMNQDQPLEKVDVYARYTKDGLKDVYGVTANILGIDPEAYRLLNNPDHINMTPEEQSELFLKTENAKYMYSSNQYLIQLETGILNNSTLASLGSACIVVVIIIIFTSVFCIKNSFDISITEKIRQYGMLSSVGATRKQIKKNVYYEALILGLIGIPLGLVLGHAASFILIIVSNKLLLDMMAFSLVFEFSWAAIIVAVALGFVTLLLSARQSARKASKVSPIQAIRNSEEIKISAAKVRSPKLVRQVFGVGGEIAHKNLKRSKKKYRTTVISITVCVTVFVALSSFVNLGFAMIQAEFTSYDYNVSVGHAGSTDSKEKVAQIRALEGINQMSVVTDSTIVCTNSDFTKAYQDLYPDAGKPYTDEEGEVHEYTDYMHLNMLDEQSFREYVEELHLDYDKVKEKGILINTVYGRELDEDGAFVEIEIDKYNFKKGDVIEGSVWEYNSGEKELSHEMNVEVAAITDQEPFGVYNGRGEAVLIVSDYYMDTILATDFYEMVYIDAQDPDSIQDQVEKIFEDINCNIYNVAENARAMKSVITLAGIFLYGFIIVISLIGVTNIFNTITTNMNLRRREFAMLKSVGMTRKEFNRMIQLESFFYGLKSLVIGLPLGCVLSVIIYQVMMDGLLVLKYRLPVGAMIISAVAVFLLITCIMRYSIRKIGKQNIIETIRNENI